MKLKITALLFLISLSNNLFAQSMEKDWYTPLRNKLLNIVISKDSILFKKCSFDSEMKDYGYNDMALKIEKSVNGNYIVSETKDSLKVFYLMNFRIEKGRNNLNVVSLNEKFESVAAAENGIKSFGQIPMSIILLDKSAIDKIRKQKDISTMTAADFKNYASQIMELDSANAAYLGKKYKFTYLYLESTCRIILSDLGFNSLVKGNAFDSIYTKFSEDPESKEVYLKMTQNKK